MKKVILILLAIQSFVSYSQLSDLHYLPPLKQATNAVAVNEQSIYLATPETTAFTVNAYLGTNTTPLATFSIVKGTPAIYNLPNGNNDITMVTDANTGIVLNNSGLRFQSPGGEKFYVNYRGVNSSQAASLTSKGRQALGQNFKWGGVPNIGKSNDRCSTLGIMATEDNTEVHIYGYDSDCIFRLGNDRGGLTADDIRITLNAGESYVLEAHVNQTAANEAGWLGASIVADKNIVISNGGLNVQTIVGDGGRDAGIDQPVPQEKLGKEYVLVRGNGVDRTEFASVVAAYDNTDIYVNGAAVPVATIDQGEYFIVTGDNYSGTTAGSNMYIETSQDAYVYQNIAGATATNTAGLNFIAPLQCLMEDKMDNIPDITSIAGTTLTGGITIIASSSTPDANITVTDASGIITLPASASVAGNTEWKTYAIPNLTGDVSVYSSGPIAVGFFGNSGVKGVAGYFSGFDNIPEVKLEIIGGGGCLPNSDIAEVTGNFDAYQWYFNGLLVPGENGPTYQPTIAGDFFCRATKGPCTYDSQVVSAYYCDPDVVVRKSVDKSEITEGETATFSLEVTNFSIVQLTNLQVTDDLPAGLTFVSATTTYGTWSGNTWTIGTLESGEKATLELEVIGDEIDIPPLKSLTNTITHTQDQVDANITEDILSASIIVHNDFDNDGVNDILDVDDDNDGIYDEDECGTIICFEPIVNESFETPELSVGTWGFFNEDDIPGWLTTSTDSRIELWSNGFLSVPSFDGNQFAELNATQSSALYQNLCIKPGTVMNWSLRHRGRNGVDVMQVRIGADLATAAVQQTMSDGNTTWGYYSGTYTVPNDQVNTLFIFEAVSTAGGSLASGNLIDDIQISVGDVKSCDDNDGDGYPDNIDLDSDNDGCSDANEFYKDINADGGDGGEYGMGTPIVNPDGSITSATYNAVVAPEIFLGNTSEDLGGTDINGQQVSLGQTFEYVLRFQNTGDDNAINYSIVDVLPNNVTFNDVDVANAPGTTFTFDLLSNTVTLNVPNELVEVGDPEYSVRIEVTIALNCTAFVAACSSNLENNAFSTFQGEINNQTFTDENGIGNISGCPSTPNVASNSIYDDLSDCDQARTVQLCGDNVILAAGEGFTLYNWVLDTNGNGAVDDSDTVINDGDPDGDPSTLFVTTIGNYIVEKSSDVDCPDLVERIKVEPYGDTSSNPIVDYFNQVNSDLNPDNNLQGEIVNCSIDGDNLTKIFLCGADDEATIQLGITDAVSIVWEKLDEGSCDSTGDDCANKNGTCLWSTTTTGDNITLTASGEYRVVINYLNGCFSRFYFNVFKNELDLSYTEQDIFCATNGFIRMNNVGDGYGFQLINAINDDIIIPFASNEGPDFEIATSGTYKIQITQLHPTTGLPIDGACLFETEDIGILDRDFSVNLSANAANCNELGSINVQALNARPNYSYELRLDDGTNGGLGSLVSNQPALDEDSFVFSSLNPNNYIVITTTDDGCSDTQQITVEDTPDVQLTATNSQNITCAAGIATLAPSGGVSGTDYQMAIWSRDGVDLYATPSDIPDANLQTTINFLFRNNTDAGDYEFIAIDNNGCFAISNSITIEDLGSPTITASNTTIVCADTGTADLTVDVTGGIAPYRYSLDGGVNYQTTNMFSNLPAGFYSITVMDSSNNGGIGCVTTSDYEITQPFRLTASPSIRENGFCSTDGALVKIVNPNGGLAPYEYSFDGGTTFSPDIDEIRLLSGTYQFVLRDALGCTFDMEFTVPDNATDPSFTPTVAYECDGEGTITITPSNIADFDYTYALNGITNTPGDNNIFTNVPAGTQTVTVGYTGSISPNEGALFFENFGAGPTTKIGEIGPGYCFEPQDGAQTPCNLGPAGVLVDGEYAVTNKVTNPLTAYRSPNDHSAIAEGRFLAINPSTNLVGANSIIWSRTDLEVLANQDIEISFFAYNLRQTGSTGSDPEITVELVDASGTIINSITTAEIPKNINADDWYIRRVTMNPGTNTVVDVVLRSSQISDDGNELILDDILASQTPNTCDTTSDIPVIIESGQGFAVAHLGTINPSCDQGSNGAIRFEVANFDPLTGFEYSLDGGINWTTSFTSPLTTTDNLSEGTYTVQVRKVADILCTLDFTTTLTAPDPIIPTLALVADYTCFNTGATLEASATGGTPAYEYRLEDIGGTEIFGYQAAPRFANVPAGTYLVRVRDDKGCDFVLPTADAVTVNAPEIIAFDIAPIACYDGLNNASIAISVTNGNGGYTFRINGGAWMTPAVASDNNYTFTGLSNGSYDIEVTDSLGCISPVESIVIAPILLAKVDVLDVSSCADGDITVTPTGGTSNYVYAFIPTGTTVVDADFGPTDSFTVTNATAGGYDVYVRDNGSADPYCQYLETVTVTNLPSLAVIATPTNPLCFGETGSIAVDITSGYGPFTYELVDVDHATSDVTQTNVVATSKTYFNLTPGAYNVIITDAVGCSFPVNGITISEPEELIADVEGILPSTCTSADPNDYGFRFTNYPTTLGTIEFSADGGTTWTGDNTIPGTSDELRGYISGSNVFPSMRTVDGSGNTICQTDLPRYTIPYPLDDLDISINTIIINCNELRVEVQGAEGSAPYEYAFTDNPANFDTTTATWLPGGTLDINGNTVPLGEGSYEWLSLVPGKTYRFYVKDNNGCVRQSDRNINDISDNPMEINGDFEPSCQGANDAEITYTIVDEDGVIEPNMIWTLFDVDGNTIQTSGGTVPYSSTITVTNLAPDEYYIVVQQVDAVGGLQCVSGSENILLEELEPITGTLNIVQQISCENPGLILIENVRGGGGDYAYTISGPNGFSITGTPDNPVEIPANSVTGAYTVQVSDQYGCLYSLGDANMTLTANPTITNVAVDNCGATNTINITATPAPGSGTTFTYSIDAGVTYLSNGGVFNNVAAGTYTVFIKDENGCSSSQLVTVHPSLQAAASLTKNLGCGVGEEAEITLEVTAGSTNYEYEIEDSIGGTFVPRQAMPTTSFVAPVDAADSYTVTIYDIGTSSPCSRTFTINVAAAVMPNFSVSANGVSCNGNTDGSIAITEVNNGNNPLTYTLTPNNGSFNPASNTFENLPMGSYEITATGPNGCHIVEPNILVEEPDLITFNTPTVTQFGCSSGNTTNNATISIDETSIMGGSGTYPKYDFVLSATGIVLQEGPSNSYIMTDTNGGDVLVRVIDENGCFAEQLVNIQPFDQMEAPTVQVDQAIACSNLGEDVSINVTSTITSFAANPANYEFKLATDTTFQASNVFTDLQPGSYTFVVHNIATGCQRNVTYSVEDPNTFDIVVNTVAEVACYGDNASITLSIEDATYIGGFSWQIFDTNGTPGDRTDDGAPIRSGNSVNIGPTTAIDIPAGNYVVEISQDALPDCSKVTSFSISTPSAPITLGSITTADVGCSNDQGTATVNPLGGDAPYDIQLTNTDTNAISNVTGVNSTLFQGLTAGNYTIEVTDALGCTQVFTNAFELVLPDPIIGTVSTQELVCKDDTNAAISLNLNPRNVTSTYRYILYVYNDLAGTSIVQRTASQTGNSFDNLTAGFYSIEVLDAMGCIYKSPIVEIENPTEVNAQLLTTSTISCQQDATLTLTAQGGTAPYTWSVDGTNFNPMNELNGINTHEFQNVVVGTYSYFVQDNFNCISVISNEIVVNPIEDLTVSLDTSSAFVNCNGEASATIQANADGGLGNYQYGLFTDAGLTDQIVPYQTDGRFSNLPQGSYYINVLSEDCQVTSELVTITDPEVLEINYTVTEITCNGEEDGSIVLTASGGTGIFKYAISPKLNQFDDKNSFDKLAAGDYSVIVQDSNGCFELIEFTITEPEKLAVDLIVTPEFCSGEADGTITIVPIGGTGPYSTSLNSNADTDYIEGQFTYTNLAIGDYIVFIKDANGCETNQIATIDQGVNINAQIEVFYDCSNLVSENTIEVTLEDRTERIYLMYALDSTDPNDLQLTTDFPGITTGSHTLTIAHENGCVKTIPFEVESFEPLTIGLEQLNLNEITATAEGGREDYTFYFNDVDNGNDNTYSISKTGTYTVTVVDANGCEAVSTIYMEFIDIEIPNFFTPDGDGLNEYWIPRNIDHFPNLFLKVYDRYGRYVFDIQDNPAGWDGLYKEIQMPTGDYWYVIKLNGEDDTREFIGHFTLYR